MEPRLTDFIESLLDDAITTEATFEKTGGGATITVSGITIIAFLGRGEDTVTADGSAEDFGGKSTRRTEICWDAIAVITLFGGNSHAVTAGGSSSEM
jgi:hypothetical protein